MGRWLFAAAFFVTVFAAVRWFIRGAVADERPRVSGAVVDCKRCKATVPVTDAVFVPGSRNEWVCRGACRAVPPRS